MRERGLQQTDSTGVDRIETCGQTDSASRGGGGGAGGGAGGGQGGAPAARQVRTPPCALNLPNIPGAVKLLSHKLSVLLSVVRFKRVPTGCVAAWRMCLYMPAEACKCAPSAGGGRRVAVADGAVVDGEGAGGVGCAEAAALLRGHVHPVEVDPRGVEVALAAVGARRAGGGWGGTGGGLRRVEPQREECQHGR